MNKRGFTLVELITTFALTAVIVTILINISLIIKNIYSKFDTKTQLLIEQANLSEVMNSKINKNNLIDYSTCTDSNFCYEFNLQDGDSIKLIVNSSSITFGDYVYKPKNGTAISTPTLTEVQVNGENSFLSIKIPITNKLYPNEEFGVNLVYQYNINYTGVHHKIIARAVTSSNKTAAGKVPQGNFDKGDEYIVNVDGTHEYHFYVLSTEGYKVNLIMSKNICSDGTLATESNGCKMAWISQTDYNDDANYGDYGNTNKGPITAMNYLYEATKNWSNISNIQLNYTDEGNTGSYGYGTIKTNGNTTTITKKDGTVTTTYNNLKARMPKLSEIEGTGCISKSFGSCPAWMVNGLNPYTDKYTAGTKEDISNISGYWSLSSDSSYSNSAMTVYYYGLANSFYVLRNSSNGIRPVITLTKSNFSH